MSEGGIPPTAKAILALGRLRGCHEEVTALHREPVGWRDHAAHALAILQAYVWERYSAYEEAGNRSRALAAWNLAPVLTHIAMKQWLLVNTGKVPDGWCKELAAWCNLVGAFLQDCQREDALAREALKNGRVAVPVRHADHQEVLVRVK